MYGTLLAKLQAMSQDAVWGPWPHKVTASPFLMFRSLIVHSAEDCETLDIGRSHETSHIVMQDMEKNGKESDPMLLP